MGTFGRTDSAKNRGIASFDQIERCGRKSVASALKSLPAHFGLVESKPIATEMLQHSARRWHHLAADAVTSEKGYLLGFHVLSRLGWLRG